MPAPDHYQLLGIPRDSSRAEIRRAFVERMKRHHPDRAGTAAGQAVFASALGEAYACLCDPHARNAYDLALQRRGPDRTSLQRHRKPPPHAPRLRFGRKGFALVVVAVAVMAVAVDYALVDPARRTSIRVLSESDLDPVGIDGTVASVPGVRWASPPEEPDHDLDVSVARWHAVFGPAAPCGDNDCVTGRRDRLDVAPRQARRPSVDRSAETGETR